jgi:hypothetical protein
MDRMPVLTEPYTLFPRDPNLTGSEQVFAGGFMRFFSVIPPEVLSCLGGRSGSRDRQMSF